MTFMHSAYPIQGRPQAVTRPVTWPYPSDSLLLDWDPHYSLSSERVSSIQFEQSGSGSITRVLQANGRYAGVFPGTAGLVATSSPFAALSDLSGGVSIYVVCERTDAGGTFATMLGANNTASGNNINAIQVQWTNANALACYSAGPTGGYQNDTESGLALDTVTVASAHITTTSRTSRIDGSGTASATTTSADPAGLGRVVLGAQAAGLETISTYFTGAIYRVIVAEGAYDADLMTLLLGLYA